MIIKNIMAATWDYRILARRTAFLMALPLLSAGCATGPSKPPTMDLIQQEMREGVQERKIPDEVSEALLPPVEIPDDSAIDEEAEVQRFDITAEGMPVRQFFMSLMEGTPNNVVVHPEVSGEISLDLQNVSVAEVMDIVRDIYGFEYERVNSIYKIFPPRLQSRVFQVSYLNVKRTGSSDVRISTGQISTGGSTNQSASSGTGASGTTLGDGARRSEIAGSTINTTSEADFWKELRETLNAMVGNGDGKKVIVNPGAGIVIVHSYPAELREIQDFLGQIQNIVQRQVILEAKVLEVELNDSFQSGINWSALGEFAGSTTAIGSQIGGGSLLESGSSEIAGNTGNLNPSNFSAVTGSATSAFGGVFSLALNLNDFTAFIELLETQGDVQVLSSPRISTVNNQKAVIKVGTDEFFVTDVSTTTTSSAGAQTTTPDITLTPFFSGIALDVTPQISDKGKVILHIHPSVSEVQDQTKTFTVGDQDQQLPLALSSIRESDNVIRANNGQIVVIGGLMQDRTTNDIASVPILGDIPLFGQLFRHTRRVTTKSELVILLKPVVVGESGEEWADSMGRSMDSFNQLDRHN